MAKQMKKTTKNASKFFDEMEQKMEEQDSKRRKISKKPGLSQPELSFLQFKPKENTGIENIYFSNKFFSQPTGNRSNLNKKSWRPPMRANDGSDDFKRNFLTKESTSEQNEKPVNEILCSSTYTNCKTNLQTNDYVDNISVEVPSAVHLSSPFHKPRIEPQTITINLSNSNHSISENEDNTYCMHQNTSCSKRSNSACDLPCNSPEEINPITIEPYLKEKVNPELLDNKSAPISVNKENSGESVPNGALPIKSDSENKLMKDPMDKPIFEVASVNYDQENYQLENNNRENTNCQIEEIIKFTEMLTQENLNLKTRNRPAAFKETNYNDASTKLDYSDHKGLDSGNNKSELMSNSSIGGHNENEDIISSIDMILSEGQNTSNNESQKEKVDCICKNNEADKNSQTLVDSVFENSSSDDVSEICDLNNSIVTASKIVSETNENTTQDLRESITNTSLYKNSAETRPKNIDTFFSNIHQKEDITQMEVTADNLSLPEKFIKGKNKNTCTKSRPTTSNESELSCKENIQEEQTVVGVDKKDDCDMADDEYSCLMISNSQLLEIEQNYYETPLKKESTGATSNGKNCKTYNERLTTNKKFVSVSTQTEKGEHTSTEPFTIPHLQWPSKMIETQKRLQNTIQEIQRLNAVLLQVRKEIWPQQNIKEMSEAGFSKKDGGNSSWKKRQ